jgi:hypothetical protein
MSTPVRTKPDPTDQERAALGEGGNITINAGDSIDLGALTPPLRAKAIQCIGEVTFTTLTDDLEMTHANATPAEDLTYPSGFTLLGKFKVIAPSAGAVRLTLEFYPAP